LYARQICLANGDFAWLTCGSPDRNRLGASGAGCHSGLVTTGPGLEIVVGRQDAPAVERLLRALPDWFGIEGSIIEYVDAARTMPTVLARRGEEVVGVLLWTRHFAESAEVHLMAVEPSYHRSGIGRRLLEAAESEIRAVGVHVLEVKTLGPSRPHAGYAKTRLFYEACGFEPLEEMLDVWPENPMLIMVKWLGEVRS
jgi:GNAT superfamily N-acetyltransferase